MKKIIMTLSLITLLMTAPVQASTWTIADNYIGGTILEETITSGWSHNGGDVIAMSNEIKLFDVDHMTVAITTDGDVTVQIQTDYRDSLRGTNYGDLFVSVNGWNPYGTEGSKYIEDKFGLGQTWDYAFVTPSETSSDGNVYSGNYYMINQDSILTSNEVMTADSHHYRNDQEVLYRPVDGAAADGTFAFSHAGSLISYAFNLSAFDLTWEDELDLGFHWTMTCANDVIQGGIYKAAVPEPATMLLLGMGIAGLGIAGRKRRGRQ